VTEHLSLDEIEQYRRGRAASPARLLALDDHLALCAACRSKATEMENVNELLLSLKSDLSEADTQTSEHLTSEQLAAYVDDSLVEVDREIAENHLTVCRACEREARELMDFKATITPQLNERHEPATSQLSASQPGRKLLSSLWPQAWSASPLRAAVVAAAVLLLTVGSAWLIWKRVSNEDRQVAQSEGAPTAPVANNDQSTNAGNSSQPDVTPTQQTHEEGATDIVLALNDGGGSVTLDADGNLSGLETLAPAQAEAVKTALRTQRVVNPSTLAGIGTRGGVLRGDEGQGSETFIVRSPIGVIVETPRPTLRWDALDGATYTVTIYDSNFNPITTSGALVSPSWTPPRALARGQIYSWQVTALKQGVETKSPRPPAPEAKFKVLEGGKAAEIQRVRRSQPNSHLALGVLYAQAGLLDDAEREFNALLRANPKSEIARKLLNNVRNAKNAR
jgi:anti-sigma factor RsiW